MAGIIDKKLVDAMKFAPLATIDNTLEGRAGDTISLPSFSYIGDAATLAENTALTPDQLTATALTVTIHKIAKGVEITDEAILSGYGDPVGEIAKQLALSIASQEDNEVLTTLSNIALPMTYLTASGVAPTDTDIIPALEKFGEDIDGTKVALVSPAVYTAMRSNVHTWIPASELAANVAIKGVVGEYQGCQVIVSNKLTSSGNIYIVKPEALRIFIKRGTVVEADRNILKFTNVFTASKHFATYLYDASKAIKIAQPS
jgi:N4-gp56 family major capsid protein